MGQQVLGVVGGLPGFLQDSRGSQDGDFMFPPQLPCEAHVPQAWKRAPRPAFPWEAVSSAASNAGLAASTEALCISSTPSPTPCRDQGWVGGVPPLPGPYSSHSPSTWQEVWLEASAATELPSWAEATTSQDSAASPEVALAHMPIHAPRQLPPPKPSHQCGCGADASIPGYLSPGLLEMCSDQQAHLVLWKDPETNRLSMQEGLCGSPVLCWC